MKWQGDPVVSLLCPGTGARTCVARGFALRMVHFRVVACKSLTMQHSHVHGHVRAHLRRHAGTCAVAHLETKFENHVTLVCVAGGWI